MFPRGVLLPKHLWRVAKPPSEGARQMAVAAEAGHQCDRGDVKLRIQQVPLGTTQPLHDDVLGWRRSECHSESDQQLMCGHAHECGQCVER